MKTDVLTSGSTVKDHISLKTVFGYNATRRTSFRSWFQACQRANSHSSTPMTPSRQERNHFTSSSSLSIWLSTVFILVSLKTNFSRSVRRPKLQGPRAEDATAEPPRAENFCDLIVSDHKVLSDGCESRNNHRCAVVVQDLATQ